MRAGEVAQALAAQADSVASHLLPNGKRQGREWCAGSVDGEAGESLKVCIQGPKAGVWCDFEAGSSGDLIDLWAARRGIALGAAIMEAKEFLGIRDERRVENVRRPYSKPTREGISRLPPQIAEWLTVVRKISPATIERFKLASRKGALMFPYLRDGELVAAKYRKVPAKEFFVDADCEPSLFGWQAFPADARSVVLCEGEMDALAFAEYGVPALSVPFGGGTGAKQAQWIDAEYDRLAVFDVLFLAMDDDQAGREATAEIVKRLGRERCRIVRLPAKDANECLLSGVPRDDIIAALSAASTLDPEQLRNASEYTDDLVREFANQDEQEAGIYLPWRKVHGLLTLRMGEVSIWAGYNGHGKSETVGNIAVAALVDGWQACVASMEFKSVKWLKRLVRQASGLAWPSGANVRHIGSWFSDKLWVFDVSGTSKASTILDVFGYAAKRYGVKLFIIDNLAKCGFAEDDYNGQKAFVDALTDFAKNFDVHVILVCHMRKGETEEKPGGKMQVKGSGGVTDMTDTLVLVWRNKLKEKRLREFQQEQMKLSPHEREDVPREIVEQPDAVLTCAKQRNGEHEPTIVLWFDRASHQYVQSERERPRQFVGLSIVNAEDSQP